jgi:23S rRNA (guanosine2251-2'-O)-methyltransferase
MVLYGKNTVMEYLQHTSGTVEGTLLIARSPQCRQAAFARERAQALGIACIECVRRDLDNEYPGCPHQGFILFVQGRWAQLPPEGMSAGRTRPDKMLPYMRDMRGGERRMRGGPGFAWAPEGEDNNTGGRAIRQDPCPFDWEKELPAAIGRGEKPRVLILDQVQDPGNLGAIVRSAAQFGVSCIFTPRDKASSFTPAARKSACGGENFVPVVQVVNLARLLDTLKDMGFWSAAACSDGGKALGGFDFNFPYAIILGSEGKGVRRLLLEKADQKLCIPMTGRIDSLNVSVAAGIILYAMYTQQLSGV